MKSQTLRQHLKRVRLALPAQARAQAEAAALQKISKYPRFIRAHRIAGYFGIRGELDPMPLIERAAAHGKVCYLPVLHPFRNGTLLFCRWHPGDTLIRNRFGIPEPQIRAHDLIAARNLDLVIVPLLGFDDRCHRLGMGGGYYDRSFAFKRFRRHITRPFLLGFAHESQRVDRLQPQPWDITLDAVVTEHRLYRAQHAD